MILSKPTSSNEIRARDLSWCLTHQSHRSAESLVNMAWEPASGWSLILSQPHPSIGSHIRKMVINSYSSVFPMCLLLAMPLDTGSIILSCRFDSMGVSATRVTYTAFKTVLPNPKFFGSNNGALLPLNFTKKILIHIFSGGRCDQGVRVTA